VQGGTYSQGTIAAFYAARTHQVGVETYVPGTGWKTLALFPATLADSDSLGARALADGTVRVYVNGATIGTANAGGFFAGKGGGVGLWFVEAGAALLDGFGGGTLAP
jgi:uncharacterized protein